MLFGKLHGDVVFATNSSRLHVQVCFAIGHIVLICTV